MCSAAEPDVRIIENRCFCEIGGTLCFIILKPVISHESGVGFLKEKKNQNKTKKTQLSISSLSGKSGT